MIGGEENPSPLHLTSGYLQEFSRRLCTATTHSRSGWTARGRQCDRDRCDRSDSVCVLHTRRDRYADPRRESGRRRSLASKMPRSFLVKKHFNSSKKPNYSELDTHTGNKTKSNATVLLLRLRSLRGSNEEGWDCFSGFKEWVNSFLVLFFSFSYKEGVLRNMSMLPIMNPKSLLIHLNSSYLEWIWSFPVLYLLMVESKLSYRSFRKFHCFIVSGCIDSEAACCLEKTLQL